MWFKNLRIYRITGKVDLSSENLEQRLARETYKPCGNTEFSRYGWTRPLGKHSEQYTHSCNGYTLLCARKQEKILPAAAINELVEEKILELESRQGRSVYRKERGTIKENVIQSLLPRALTRSFQVYAYLTPDKNLLAIDAAQASKAEEFLDYLRFTLGQLPVVPLDCHGESAEIMTRWLKQRTPKGFELDGECELQNPLDARNIVRCKHQDLQSNEVREHVKAGKRVIQLALNWKNAISFILNEDLSMRRLRFEDSIQQEAETEADDFASCFDQDFAVMSLELSGLVDELIDVFGGLSKGK